MRSSLLVSQKKSVFCSRCLLMMMALLITGCGGADVDLVDVNGTVTLNGEPLAGAGVIFQPVGGGRSSFGRKDENGHFDLLYVEGKTGALPGEHLVLVSARVEPDRDSSDSARQAGRPETVPKKINADTTLRAELQPGSDAELEFNLSSNEDLAKS
ncbi:MAG: carboxypeptidase regulatory-like domain-containing protein [Planctomyces sp.]